MKNSIKASIEALPSLLLVAILTGWAGTIQIHGPGGIGFLFDSAPQSSIHKQPLLFEGAPAPSK